MKDKLRHLLHTLGISRRYAGYRITVAAVLMAIEDEDRMLCITRDLYEPVAEQLGCPSIRVERNIRTIIYRAWDINRPLLTEIAGFPLTSPPTVSQFIDILISYILRSK